MVNIKKIRMVRIRQCNCEDENCKRIKLVFKFVDDPNGIRGNDWVFTFKNKLLLNKLIEYGEFET